jgi:hypothetical protein
LSWLNGKKAVSDVELLVVVVVVRDDDDDDEVDPTCTVRRETTGFGVIQARWLGTKAYAHVVHAISSATDRIIVALGVCDLCKEM